MIAQLVALNDGASILLDKPVLLLGRHPECDIQIDSRKISRRHCCIALVGDFLVVRDLGSTNGIRVNGVRVVEGKLSAGDELTVGNQRYQVRWGLPEKAARPEAPPRLSAPVAPPNDADLEACDEPIPLEENPSSPIVPVRGVQAPGPVPPRPKPPTPFVLPDHIDLAPASDNVPRPSPPAG